MSAYDDARKERDGKQASWFWRNPPEPQIEPYPIDVIQNRLKAIKWIRQRNSEGGIKAWLKRKKDTSGS